MTAFCGGASVGQRAPRGVVDTYVHMWRTTAVVLTVPDFVRLAVSSLVARRSPAFTIDLVVIVRLLYVLTSERTITTRFILSMSAIKAIRLKPHLAVPHDPFFTTSRLSLSLT